MTAYELVVIKGSQKGQIHILEEDETIIGRDSSCQLSLNDPTVSRHHARIVRRRATEFFIEDLGSANGILVNGIRLKNTTLKENDRITLGNLELLVRRRGIAAALAAGQPLRVPGPAESGGSHQLIQQQAASFMSITQTLDSGQLLDLLGRSHASLRAMYRIIEIASSIFDLDVLLNRVLDETFATIRPERAFILLKDAEAKQLEVKASRWQQGLGPDQQVSISQNIISHVLEKEQSVVIADAMADSKFGLAKSVVLHKIRSAMCSPLRGRSRIVGIIHVDTSTAAREFGHDDLMLLDAIGSAAGIAVENIQLYREKIENERLAAIGQAISGLSHYIKNILAAMETSHSMMQKGLDAGDLNIIRRLWKILKRSNERISNLVLDMLAYSKETKPTKQLCQVNDICVEVAEMCQELIKARKAELRLELDPELPQIEVDPQGIHRCLLNLLTNAIEALDKERGLVKISSRLEADAWVSITVEDNGAGIPEEIRQRIFEVFFSTKGSRGTGLGLAVTRKIVEEHGGSIELRSSPRQGSSFTIRLPAHRAVSKQ